MELLVARFPGERASWTLTVFNWPAYRVDVVEERRAVAPRHFVLARHVCQSKTRAAIERLQAVSEHVNGFVEQCRLHLASENSVTKVTARRVRKQVLEEFSIDWWLIGCSRALRRAPFLWELVWRESTRCRPREMPWCWRSCTWRPRGQTFQYPDIKIAAKIASKIFKKKHAYKRCEEVVVFVIVHLQLQDLKKVNNN